MPEIAGPEPGTTLSGTTETFAWVSNGFSVGKYKMFFGASVGAKDLGATGKLPRSRTAYTKTGLPANGGTVYIRFQYKKDGVWHLVANYQYTAVTGP